ncbi:GolD/DthD family dehydrogenase [Microbacterium sp. Leaf159]|uniref:GolD/DthD family dehydrogenase n=1 Tax=Microbacterium sp. Leaf159 TaxID=1736279 RepID=UPI0006FE7EA1|nr:D-threitol dehydrogenase [Microbacterium sp. Leaf159]KQR37479.1 short-chain dehydrogenase [Microbacterium sp. Leaf159]
MTSDFSDKTALVTGAASGIGEAISQLLAERGATIVAVDRSDRTASVCDALPGDGHTFIRTDLTDATASVAIAAQLEATGTIPDILVNCAGIAVVKPAIDISASEWQSVIDVNLNAAFFLSQAIGGLMLTRGSGRIISIASQAATVALEGHVAYCASKSALLGMTRVLALEWASAGITVNTVSPTIVNTPMATAEWSGDKGDRARAAIPVGRFAEPAEVAGLVAYLASEESAMITGQDVRIDGGYTIA